MQVCTLKYRNPLLPVSANSGPTILLAVKDGAKLSLYISPKLRDEIDDTDWDFIEDLLQDLSRRAVTSPEVLFQQLSDLSVGPLVTDAVETMKAREIGFRQILSDFCLLVR